MSKLLNFKDKSPRSTDSLVSKTTPMKLLAEFQMTTTPLLSIHSNLEKTSATLKAKQVTSNFIKNTASLTP